MAFSPHWSNFVPQLYLTRGVARFDFLSAAVQQRSTMCNLISSMMDRQNEHKLTGQPDFGWDMPNKPFLTIGEVADILQVSSRTVYNLIYKGTLRACRITYHITLITKEDFFLMIKETTYCKRSVSLFAKQSKKTKKKMEERKTGHRRNQHFPDKRGRKEQRAARPNGGSFRRQTTSSPFVTHLRTGKVSGGDLYTMAEICQKFNYTYGRFYNLRMRYSIPCIKANSTKCFPKAEV